MSTDELLQTVTLSPDPAMFRPRPSSKWTQDISHLLTSLFKNLYTGEVIGKDACANLIRSRGGDNAYHQKFVDELQQIRTEYDRRTAEADMVERHIIQARARATAQEERILNGLKNETGELPPNLGLPPVESQFRWCVDNDVLRKHKLICPEDYITDEQPITKAPKGKSEPSFFKETFSFHKRVSKSPVDDGYLESPEPEIPVRSHLDGSVSSLSLSSTSDNNEPSKRRPSQKGKSSKKVLWKQEMRAQDKEYEQFQLAQLEQPHNFLKNPRFLPPSSKHSGRSLIAPTKKREKAAPGSKNGPGDNESNEAVPVFLANPPVVFFPDYEVGQIYEMTVELRNVTASSRHVRIIPPSTPYFSIGLGKFPGEGGIVAPGMSCHYTVRFVPDSLSDFEDFILVESQAPYPVLVPIEARRPPPILTIPQTLACGPCLVGGVKLMECFCRNEGLSRGSFCIMPKSVWPPANFRSVATSGFVEQAPFGIRPAAFELYPGQAITIEVVFFPTSSETYNQVFTIVCDNCQVQDITLTGYGQLAALELVSVNDTESVPSNGKLTDIKPEHLVYFQPANLCSTLQKNLVIRNTTHVELPFYWQIMKPNLQGLLPGEPVDTTKIEYSPDASTPFIMSPVQGILLPHQDHSFTVKYTPTEMIEYHSVAQMVLRDVPKPPSAGKKPGSLAKLAPTVNDVIIMDLELKGATEPFQILLEPYAIIFPGESFIGTTMRKQFKMWNNSKSAIAYHWENITDCHIIQIEPRSGTIEPQKYYEFELFFTGEQCGFTSQTVTCHIEHSLEPVVLHVEAMFKGPEVSIDVPSLDLGLIKLGDRALSELTIENKSPLAAKWSILESRACLAERQEEESQFSIHPDSGELLPLAKAVLSVLFKPMTCQRLKTVLELQVENAKGSHLAVTADVQVPQVCLLSSTLEFTDVYVGVPAQSTVKMFNQGRLPTRFTWGELTGSQSVHCSATVTPASGILGPNEEAEMCVNLTANILDDVNDIALCCRVEDMKDPLVLSMKAKAKGLHATYSLSEEEETLDQSPPSTPEELLLDFGSDVSLQNTVQRKLVLTNHSGICAPFSLEAAYFTGCPVPQVLENSPSTVSLIQRTSRIATQAAKKAQADFRRSVLADGKGAAFLFQPKSGTLGAFQQISIQVTAYTNMWGEYSDELLCKVGDLKVKVIPMKMTVVGCPVYFQMTGPRPDKQTDGPVIRFGTHLSGGDTISRGLRINNPSPYDIRIDWETYNREERSSKLLDLVMLYGDPFPLKDIDGNEIVGSRLDYPESVGSPVNWDTIPSTSGTISSSSSRAISHLKDVEQAEDIEQDDNEDSQDVTVLSDENKLISVILRPHEGVASDYPYCITPRQTIVPAGGSSTVHVSFTPLMLSGVINKTECSGFALGFMSLDDKFAQTIPGKVKRLHGYGVEPIRMEFQAFVKPALLTVEVEDEDEGLVFYSVASDLIPDKKTCQILTKSVTTQSLKLLNCTETPLYFRLLLSSPFSVSSIDPTKSIKTSHSDRDEQGEQLVLHPQQNTLVKVSFCTSLELLTYQNLPANQMLPGVKLLQSENGEKKLHFTQELLIEYSNKSAQRFPLNAYLSVPVLQLSHHTVDFGTCFVGQTRTQEVYLLNKSGSKSYWTALMDKKERDSDHEIFSMSPTSGMLEAHITHASDSKEALLITFTARDSRGYQTTVMIHGLLGEKPLTLHIKGHGSYDEKYEAFVSV
ncbi:deleted in lung and esophageal cancer protein 1 [Rhinophrynus dorsalis]